MSCRRNSISRAAASKGSNRRTSSCLKARKTKRTEAARYLIGGQCHASGLSFGLCSAKLWFCSAAGWLLFNWGKVISLLSSVASGVTSLFQHKPFTQEAFLGTCNGCTPTSFALNGLYTNNKGHISHVVVLGQDTVVPPALAFAACFQIQHWGSGGLAAWGRPPVQTRHGRLEVPAKMANPKKMGEIWWDIRLYTHSCMHPQMKNEVFSPNSSNMYIIEKIMGHFHRRAPSKVHFIYHIIWTGA